MSTRETLLQRADIPDADVDDVIAIAAELQDADRAAAEGASLEEVEQVAGELDIAPAYVEEALTELKRRREDAAADAAQQAALRKQVLLGGAGLLAGGALLLLLWVGSALPGLWSTAAELDASEAQLNVVIDRQASLAPQLVALAGGEASEVSEAVQAVRAAEGVDERLVAADALGTQMATALARLPPTDDASKQLRLNLQYEITGTANRIATERQRYEQTRAAYEHTRSGLRAAVATSVGLAR
mgnify:CR=1 FL=1